MVLRVQGKTKILFLVEENFGNQWYFVNSQNEIILNQNEDLMIFHVQEQLCFETVRIRPQNSIKSLCFSPNGSVIASGGYDKVLRLWNANSISNQIFEENHSCGISANLQMDKYLLLLILMVKFDFGRYKLKGIQVFGNMIQIMLMIFFQFQNFQRIQTIYFPRVKKISFKSLDIISIDANNFCCCLSAQNFSENSKSLITIKTPEGHEIKNPHERISSISLQKAGKQLLSGRDDCAFRIWCTNKYTLLTQFFLTDYVTKVSFSPDGFYLIAGTYQGAVCGCLKEFSQQPLLQKENCQESNLTLNQQDQSLIQDQSLQVLFEQKQQNQQNSE